MCQQPNCGLPIKITSPSTPVALATARGTITPEAKAVQQLCLCGCACAWVLASSHFALAMSAAAVLFDDIFEIKDIDPDGKMFDKGTERVVTDGRA